MKFRKKPIIVEAYHFNGTLESYTFLNKWSNGKVCGYNTNFDNVLLDIVIDTLEGQMFAYPGYWIIKGVAGEFYGCESNIFYQTYEEVYSLDI